MFLKLGQCGSTWNVFIICLCEVSFVDGAFGGDSNE